MNDIIIIDGVEYRRVKAEYTRVEESHKPTPKYRVGDWVRVISNKSSRPDSESYLGKIVKIARVYDHGEYKREVNNELVPAYGIGKTFVLYEDELEPAEEPAGDPFDIKPGDLYYWIGYNGQIRQDVTRISDPAIAVANACKDEALMKQRALHEILNRLLWRASIEAGEPDNPWDSHRCHFSIYKEDDNFYIAKIYDAKYLEIYFPSNESAQSAIDNIIKPFVAKHPDFVW